MRASILLVLLVPFWTAPGQNPADSVTVVFRAHEPSNQTVFVPGQFNNWGPNSGGQISPGAISQMTYDAGIGAWLKSYTFRIHDGSDARRTLGDSVFQYKFNVGGSSGGWKSDPLNPEQNPNDNGNSILRLTTLAWFEVYASEANQQITRLTAGLIHANSDTIVSVELATATTQNSEITYTDVTSNYIATKRVVDVTLSSPIPRSSYVRLVARNNRGDSVVYRRGGYVITTLPLPSYAKQGVTLPSIASNDSTTFRLTVPGKDFVFLRLAPLGQSPATATPVLLRHGTNNSTWWTNVKLAAGTYEYVYEIENGKVIYDPWGRWNGTYGSRFTVGPEGLTADNYVWTNTSYSRPPLNKVVLYELNIGEFVGGRLGLGGGQGTFRHLTSMLGYFDSLGVNGIELMPINDYGNIGKSGFSWGYDISSFLALEPGYGDPKDFKTLVDSAHGRGIAVIVDVVYNHLTETTPLWQMLPNDAANPYFKRGDDLRYNEDGLLFFKDIDHWTAETQALVYASLKMWIDDYRVDGFRFDYTQGIGWNTAEPTKGILGWSGKIHQEYNGSIYQIAEHLPESPALILHSGMTSGWHDSYRDEMFKDVIPNQRPSLATLENLALDLGAYPGNDTPTLNPNRYSSRIEPVNMNANHDEFTPIFEMITYQGVSLTDALKRDKVYATFLFASLGIPMLWQGMEFGAPRGWPSEGQKLAYRPLEWNIYPTSNGQSHYRHYKSLIFQRKNNPALFAGELRKLRRYDAERVLVWGMEDAGSGSKVMCVANLSGADRTLTNVPWLDGGTWYDVFTQSVFSSPGTIIPTLTIPAYTSLVYSNKSNSQLVDVDDTGDPPLPSRFELLQNVPNPFNPSTHISFSIPTSSHTTVTMYDVLGREIAVLVSDELAAGSHNVTWDATGFASGMYLCRLTSGPLSTMKKVLLLR